MPSADIFEKASSKSHRLAKPSLCRNNSSAKNHSLAKSYSLAKAIL
jgi:hypothetical protein